jgi:hypothetical protein
MQNNMEWTKRYYADEAQEEIVKRKATVPPEAIEQAPRAWPELIKKVEQAIADGEKPEGAQAQALAERWATLFGDLPVAIRRYNPDSTRCMQMALMACKFPRMFSEKVQEFM